MNFFSRRLTLHSNIKYYFKICANYNPGVFLNMPSLGGLLSSVKPKPCDLRTQSYDAFPFFFIFASGEARSLEISF